MQRVGIRFAAIHSPTPQRPTGSRPWVLSQGRLSNGVLQSGLIERDDTIGRASASERGGALLPPLYCQQLFASFPSCTKERASGIASSASTSASINTLTSVASSSRSHRRARPSPGDLVSRTYAGSPNTVPFAQVHMPTGNLLVFHRFLGRGDMSAFASGTGSGSSQPKRRYQRVTGEAGDPVTASSGAISRGEFDGFVGNGPGLSLVLAQEAPKRSSSENTTQRSNSAWTSRASSS